MMLVLSSVAFPERWQTITRHDLPVPHSRVRAGILLPPAAESAGVQTGDAGEEIGYHAPTDTLVACGIARRAFNRFPGH